MAAEVDGALYLWEFHEHQHRDLSGSQSTSLYSPSGDRIDVPRFFQRLVRDVWKILAFPNCTIVWWDWFTSSTARFDPELHIGFEEHALPGRFSFSAFLQYSRASSSVRTESMLSLDGKIHCAGERRDGD